MVSALKVHGADLSHHNSGVDLKKAKQNGLDWVYNKCTEGTSYRDPSYMQRKNEAREAGLPFGGYHFARPDGSDAVKEAEFFFRSLEIKAGDLAPVLDFEVTYTGAEKWCKDFMHRLEELLAGVKLEGKPIHYGPNDFGADYDYLRWVPRYNNTNTPPDVHWDIWQFSNGQYGVPKSFPGLGNVDLNHMRDGLRLEQMVMSKADAAPKTRDFKIMHLSGEVYDPLGQRKTDYEKVAKLGADVFTGTEVGPGEVRPLVREIFSDHNYRVYLSPTASDGWIAVKKDIITGHFEGGSIHVLDSAPAAGDPHPYSRKDITWVKYESDVYGGGMAHGAFHMLTKGRWPGQAQEDKPGDPVNHYQANKMFGRKLADFAIQAGVGPNKSWLMGDSNLLDSRADIFVGKPVTTCWDELKKYPDTGHGNIDVIASLDADQKVTCKSARVYTDRDLPLNTDHYLVEAVYSIKV